MERQADGDGSMAVVAPRHPVQFWTCQPCGQLSPGMHEEVRLG